MPSLDIFETLAEISIALIGFAGVVVALGHSRLPIEVRRLRVTLLFSSGTGALWGGVTPAIAFSIAESPSGWLISGSLFAPVLLAVNAYAWRRLYALTRRSEVSPLAFYLITPVTLASVGYLLVSLTFLHDQIRTAQLLSVVMLTFLAILHFFQLARSLVDADAQA